MPFSKDNVVIIIIVIRRARNFEPIKKNDGFNYAKLKNLLCKVGKQ